MSRCFPFPSSGLSRKDTSHVGSIKKLHNECGIPKHGKQNNREEKKNKEKNLDGKEKSNKRSRQQDKLDYSAHKKVKLRHDQRSEFFESFGDWKKDASDQRERSGLTEEQELPSIPNPCNSSESTQNSSKKQQLLVADMKRNDKGLVLRIKLPVMKHKEPVTPNTNTQPCSSCEAVALTNIIGPSSARKASSLKEKTLMKQQHLHSTPATEDPCFSGRITEAPMIEEVAATGFKSSSCGGHRRRCRRQKMQKCFSELILNWNPSPLQSCDLNPGSQDWLFAPRRQSPHGNHNAMSCMASKPDHEVGLVSANSMQPQACYLPEFNIYQLPYVIPF